MTVTTRIQRASVRYERSDRGAGRAAALSRRALEMVASRLPPGTSGRIGRLRVDIRVDRQTSDRELAERIAEAIARRL